MIINRLISPASFADLENLSALQAQQKGLRFNLEPTLPLSHQVITDGTRLRQILWNPISNAVKFTQQGQVTVRVRYDEGDMPYLWAKTLVSVFRRMSWIKFSPCITR